MKLRSLLRFKNEEKITDNKLTVEKIHQYGYRLLPPKDKEKYIKLRNVKLMKLYKGKRRRYTPKKNDIFVIEFLNNIFVYGMILNPKIENESGGFMNKGTTYVLFDVVTCGIDYEYFMKSDKVVLFAPFVSYSGWFNIGWMIVVGNYSDNIDINYGFYELRGKIKTNNYYSDTGEKLKKVPKYSSCYGALKTDYGILTDIYLSCVLNKDLLVIDGVDYNYLLDEQAQKNLKTE